MSETWSTLHVIPLFAACQQPALSVLSAGTVHWNWLLALPVRKKGVMLGCLYFSVLGLRLPICDLGTSSGVGVLRL